MPTAAAPLGTDSGHPIATDSGGLIGVDVALTITTGTSAPAPGATSSAIDVSAPTVIKAAPGQVVTVNVTTAGSTTGAIYDLATTSGEDSSSLVGVIPEAVGSYSFGSFPCFVGILIVPGTSQVLSVAFA